MDPENFSGVSRVSDSNGVAMVMGSYRKQTEFAEATAMYAPTLHLTETQDYLKWTLSASFEQLEVAEEEFWQAGPAILHTAASSLVKEWHPSLRRIVAEADISVTFSVGFRAAEPVEAWKTTNITLLGDAIHTMPPFRGIGGNVAMRDAELLHHKLIDVAVNRVPLLQAIAEYENSMRQYGFEAVKQSIQRPAFGSGPPHEFRAGQRVRPEQ